jgi:integrase
MAVPQQLLQQLLTLDESVRLEIAHALLESVDTGVDREMSDDDRARLEAALERSRRGPSCPRLSAWSTMPTDRRVEPSTSGVRFPRACGRAGIDRVMSHTFRHIYGSWLGPRSTPPNRVSPVPQTWRRFLAQMFPLPCGRSGRKSGRL